MAVFASMAGTIFFAATETALTALTEARTRQLIDESTNASHPLKLWLDYPDRVLSTLLFGNTIANIGGGALAGDIADKLGSPHAVAIATGVMTFLVLTFCEVLPKTVAKRHPVRLALLAAPLLRILYWLLLPATVLLVMFTNAVVKLAGGKTGHDSQPSVTGAEIEYLIDLGSREGVLDDVKKDLLNSVLEFADLLVKEIMVPRTKIFGIEKTATLDEVLKAVRESDLSRIPVYQDTVDNVVGILFAKDLVRDLEKGLTPQTFKLEKYIRPPFFVPELMKISRLLREFQKRKTHMAVVVDEFGGTSGVVTLEDVLEEIVGEIQDESDSEEKLVKALPNGIWLADGLAPRRDVEAALSVELPEDGDYETLGGFLTALAGKVPAAGSLLVWNGLTFTIRSSDERRVNKVEIKRMTEKERADATEASNRREALAQPKAIA